MIDAGVLTDDDPVELLEGILVFKNVNCNCHLVLTSGFFFNML